MKQPALNRFITAMLAYAILLLLAITAVRAGWAPGWEVLLALLPLVPGIFVVFIVVASIRQMDEMQRRIQLEALAYAFGILFLALLTETLLEISGRPASDPGVYILYMAAAWMIGQLLARWRYQ